MKERILILAISCFIGLGACFFAYRHGPVSLPQKQHHSQPASPGWTPPVMPQAPKSN